MIKCLDSFLTPSILKKHHMYHDNFPYSCFSEKIFIMQEYKGVTCCQMPKINNKNKLLQCSLISSAK